MEPISNNFFKTIDKVGGPIEPTVGFNEIYTEIFIKKKTRAPAATTRDENEDASGDECDNEDESQKMTKEAPGTGNGGSKSVKENEDESKMEDADEEMKQEEGAVEAAQDGDDQSAAKKEVADEEEESKKL